MCVSVCVSRAPYVHTHNTLTEVVSQGYSSSSQDKNTSNEGGIYRGERSVYVCVGFCVREKKRESACV